MLYRWLSWNTTRERERKLCFWSIYLFLNLLNPGARFPFHLSVCTPHEYGWQASITNRYFLSPSLSLSLSLSISLSVSVSVSLSLLSLSGPGRDEGSSLTQRVSDDQRWSALGFNVSIHAAIRFNNWKLLTGYPGQCDTLFRPRPPPTGARSGGGGGLLQSCIHWDMRPVDNYNYRK